MEARDDEGRERKAALRAEGLRSCDVLSFP